MQSMFMFLSLIIGMDTFLDEEQKNEVISILPKIQDSIINSRIKSDSVYFYSDKTMPKAYQDFEGALRGIHSPSYNISANYSEPFGNGNVEFPWGKPAGMHRVKNFSQLKFINLPNNKKIEYEKNNDGSYNWEFPEDTLIGEILFVKLKDEPIVFEIRTRRKLDGKWRPNVFRPFPTVDDLIDTIKNRWPNYSEFEDLKKLIDHLKNNDSTVTLKLEDDQPNKVFSSTADVDYLPKINDENVVFLLKNTTFKSCVDKFWRNTKNPAAAPSTKEDFHIVPKNYDGAFINVDSKSCMKCHENTNDHVNKFDSGRDWYGRIRGNDGIFSFHIFDKDCISYQGTGRGVKINQKLIDLDLITIKR